ncbi:MAG: FdhF/YdeP family oxidoreductase [Candidatus Hydrogenedentota bacterium]
MSPKWTPSNWASLSPFGIGHQRPNNYKEVFRAFAKNRHELGYAWRILNDGVCDGCALGTSGMHDWTLDGIHLCNIRLRLLELNTMPAMDHAVLGDCEALRNERSDTLRNLGRLPYPMIRRKGDTGFTRISWDGALDAIAEKVRATTPERIATYMTSRGIPNESYYAVQKSMRAMGSNNIDNAARICHSPSTVALKAGIGAGATTCSYSDWLKADWIFFFGSNVANNQPVATKYLHMAKKNGARVAVVNPYREPGMENYWIPSIAESALFGTKIADVFYQINQGGDVAFINGVIKSMIEHDRVDTEFIAEHAEGFEELQNHLKSLTWQSIENAAGLSKVQIESCAESLGAAKNAVFVWSMGITQHTCGVDNVSAIVNLALTRGFVGHDGSGLMPIRGHSGVQGGAEMGAYASAFPGGVPIAEASATTLSTQWGFSVPNEPGLMTGDMLDAAHDGDLDVMFSIGGNFLEVLPDPKYIEAALLAIPLRVHMDIVATKQMFLDAADTVILLPATTRYEIPGGVTQTSTERRVIFSPEIPGRRIGEARPEWEVFLDLARRVKPELSEHLDASTTAELREEIAQVVPFYDGIQHLKRKGDQFQYGGAHLCADYKFNTHDGKAHFIIASASSAAPTTDRFIVSTRRGKQFNSMVQESRDALTGANRDDILMNEDDIQRLELNPGDPITLTNQHGEFKGRVYAAAIKRGHLQIHWPEGNVLLDRALRSPQAGVPDYNTTVEIKS